MSVLGVATLSIIIISLSSPASLKSFISLNICFFPSYHFSHCHSIFSHTFIQWDSKVAIPISNWKVVSDFWTGLYI